jgi:hypothetical protein
VAGCSYPDTVYTSFKPSLGPNPQILPTPNKNLSPLVPLSGGNVKSPRTQQLARSIAPQCYMQGKDCQTANRRFRSLRTRSDDFARRQTKAKKTFRSERRFSIARPGKGNEGRAETEKKFSYPVSVSFTDHANLCNRKERGSVTQEREFPLHDIIPRPRA